jgi:hypothetical protein
VFFKGFIHGVNDDAVIQTKIQHFQSDSISKRQQPVSERQTHDEHMAGKVSKFQ